MGHINFLSVTGYVAGVVGAVLILASKTKTDNLNDLKERVEILEKEREFARLQHLENQKAISNLEGQLASYKEIPLKSIARSLETISQTTEETGKGNARILQVLEGSALIAKHDAHDGGLLVKTKKTNPLDVTVKKEN